MVTATNGKFHWSGHTAEDKVGHVSFVWHEYCDYSKFGQMAPDYSVLPFTIDQIRIYDEIQRLSALGAESGMIQVDLVHEGKIVVREHPFHMSLGYVYCHGYTCVLINNRPLLKDIVEYCIVVIVEDPVGALDGLISSLRTVSGLLKDGAATNVLRKVGGDWVYLID